jgi:hypothetical protein
MSHEALEVPYGLSNDHAGVLGYSSSIDGRVVVCGGMVHTLGRTPSGTGQDYEGHHVKHRSDEAWVFEKVRAGSGLEPLWMNGGLYANKESSEGKVLYDMEIVAMDYGARDGKRKWHWQSGKRPGCLSVSDDGVLAGRLGPEVLEVLDKLKKKYAEIMKL